MISLIALYFARLSDQLGQIGHTGLLAVKNVIHLGRVRRGGEHKSVNGSKTKLQRSTGLRTALTGLLMAISLIGSGGQVQAKSGNLVTDGAFNSVPNSQGWWYGPAPSFSRQYNADNYFNLNSNLTGGLFDALEPGVNKSGTPNTSKRSVLNESDGEENAIVHSFAEPLQPGTYQFSMDLSSRNQFTSEAGQPRAYYSRANVVLFNADTNTDNVAPLVDVLDYELPYTASNAVTTNYQNYSGTFTVPTAGRYKLIFRVYYGTQNRNLDYYIDRVAVAD